MEQTEPIESLNRQLRDEYGADTVTGRAIYRIVWSEDQYEKRMSKFTPAGVELLQPEVQEFPKYKQWTRGPKFIMERLCYIDVVSGYADELTINKLSYEPVWTFMDNKYNALPPRWDVCKIIIDTIHAAMYHDHSLAKYAKGEGSNDGSLEETQKRVAKIQEELFGNETSTGDALAHKEAVVVPRNYDKEVH